MGEENESGNEGNGDDGDYDNDGDDDDDGDDDNDSNDGGPTVDRDIYSFKGSKPGPRSRNKKKGTSRRRPPAGLPRSLYDKDWLKTQTTSQVRRLHISKNKFVWMKVGSRKTTES
jgi:hypothetical protein